MAVSHIVNLLDVSEVLNVLNISIPTANVEQSVALNPKVKQVLLRLRERGIVKIAFSSGESGTTFFTIPPGVTMNLDKVNLASTTIYFQCNVGSTNLEILQGV
jgi:hypothetical protein